VVVHAEPRRRCLPIDKHKGTQRLRVEPVLHSKMSGPLVFGASSCGTHHPAHRTGPIETRCAGSRQSASVTSSDEVQVVAACDDCRWRGTASAPIGVLSAGQLCARVVERMPQPAAARTPLERFLTLGIASATTSFDNPPSLLRSGPVAPQCTPAQKH
jgi:hypothetical protein